MTLQFCNPINIPLKRKCVAVDYRGGIEVDEVDGRSPVERAAATFLPSCEDTLPGRLLTRSSIVRRIHLDGGSGSFC